MVIFILQNAVPITVVFLYWQIDGSLALVLLLATVAGMIIAFLSTLPSLIRDEWRYSQLVREKRQAEDELATTKRVVAGVAAGRGAVVEQTTTTIPPQPLL